MGLRRSGVEEPSGHRGARSARLAVRSRWTRSSVAGGSILALGAMCALAVGPASVPSTAMEHALPAPSPLAVLLPGTSTATPPTVAQCEASDGYPCYGPPQLQAAYDMEPLYKVGHQGQGETIVLVDAYGSPTIASDLASFDHAYGLPAPPSFKIITPEGSPTTQNGGWAEESTLDVEYSHAMAPEAKLLLVETPVNETVGTAGFPQIVAAEEYVIQHKLGNVISQSFGAAEQTFPNSKSILALRGAYTLAAQDEVTVLASTGDQGATSPSNVSGSQDFTHRVVNWPASDPLVTAVGGTQLHLNQAGGRTAPDNVWNDSATLGGPAASSGGVSSVFARPSFQAAVSSVVGSSPRGAGCVLECGCARGGHYLLQGVIQLGRRNERGLPVVRRDRRHCRPGGRAQSGRSQSHALRLGLGRSWFA